MNPLCNRFSKDMADRRGRRGPAGAPLKSGDQPLLCMNDGEVKCSMALRGLGLESLEWSVEEHGALALSSPTKGASDGPGLLVAEAFSRGLILCQQPPQKYLRRFTICIIFVRVSGRGTARCGRRRCNTVLSSNVHQQL